MTDGTLLDKLSRFATSAREDPMPDALIADATRRIRDVIGNSLAAVGTEPAGIATAVAVEMGGSPEATPLSGRGRIPASSAALVNGTLAHALDFDDTHLPSVLHPSASVVPAALAVAEKWQLSGERLCRAVAIGDEICIRLGMVGFNATLGNSVFFEHGLHATSICGAIGAAAAAATLMDLDAATIGHAMAIAVSMGAGLLEANRTGGSVKQIHCGWAAHAGIMAADLARHGLTGPPTALEGRFGFFKAYLRGDSNPAALSDGLGRDWSVTDTFFKPYPSNHFTHAVIDCALQLRLAVDLADIERVDVGVAAPVLRTIAEPPEQKARPPTGYAAKFSGPFAFAAAFLGGGGLGVYLDDFTDQRVADASRLELAARVHFVADAECTAIYPHQFPAIASVSLRDGRSRHVKVLQNRGSPQRPLTDSEFRTKFRLNAGRQLGPRQVADLDDALERLASQPSILGVLALCRMADAETA